MAERAKGRLPSWLRSAGILVLGWVLVLGGIAALILPGPGLLMLLAGLIVLSQEYEWAQRRLHPVRVRAFVTAAEGVKTRPRVAGSTFGGVVLIVAGVVWYLDPAIPEFWMFGPQLPFGGRGTGVSLALSGLIALALIVYSVHRFRGHSIEEVRRMASRADDISQPEAR